MKRNQSEASAIQTSVNRTRTRVRRAVSRLVFANPVYYLSLLGRRPRQIAAIPTNPWLGDSEQGTRLLGGKYCLAGETRVSDALWTAPDASTAWRTELHGFGWLRDLHAVGSDAARRRARELVSDWIVRYSHWDPISWRIDVLANRVISWLTEYEFFCASADDRFRALYLASLAHQARHLSRIAPGQQGGLPRFVVIEALVLAGLALPNKGKRLARALKLLERELQRQVFPDGGHVERNPSAHLRVLRHLVDIRASLAASGQEVPQNLQKAIDRMTPVLRLFRHGDGRLALFNGSVEEENWLIDAVLNRADASGRAPDGIPHSGFQRLRAGQTLAIVETGVPPPRNFDRRAHAGTLSLELSVGKDRLIVNCGGYAGSDAAWRTAQRSSAAHSTMIVANRNSSEILEGDTLGRRPAEVTCRREEADGAILVDASHDGYRARFGLVHRRRLFLAEDGTDMRGEDSLIPETGDNDSVVFALRFHLHPDVKASLVQTGDAVLIRLPSGVGWRMQAAGGALKLEESVYLGRSGEAKRSEQVVVTGASGSDVTVVKWALRRIGI